MDQKEKQQYNTYQEPFPYKTYDEILMEKERRMRFRHGMVIMSGIFLMFCAVIIGISMIWNRSANPFTLLSQTAEGGNVSPGKPFDFNTAQVSQGGKDSNFTLPFSKEPSKQERDRKSVV